MPVGTPPLAQFARAPPCEVPTLGRVDTVGRVAWEAGVWPPEGRSIVVVWRPGEAPAFVVARGRLVRAARAWRFEGAAPAGHVVAVAPES